jgi:integrase
MARKRGNDADREVRDTPAPATGNIRVPVPGERSERGLNALITAAGWRGFVLRYRINGRERSYTIGGWPNWTTEQARARARELRQLIDQGIDPHEQDAQVRAEAVIVTEFWRQVYEPLHVVTLRSSWAGDVRAIKRNDVLPKLGSRPIREIDQADIAALHRAITKRGAPKQANRTVAAISNMMSWAERPHITEDGRRIPALRPKHSNPCSGIKRNPEEPRQRFLQPDEMTRLAEALERHPERTTVALVRFLLFTGARFGEAASARWDQINLELGTWTKPSSHTKQKREHVTYLSKPALMLLQELHERNGSSPYLFPGPTGKPITTIKTFWRSATRQAGLERVRVHDLRHSFASVLAANGGSLLLIGQLLGHTQAKTTLRYAHLVDSVQREAVERAGAVIAGNNAQSAELVQLRR